MWRDKEKKRGSSGEGFTYTHYCLCMNILYIAAFRLQGITNSVINMCCAILASWCKSKPNKSQSELLILGKTLYTLVALCTAHNA